MNRLRLAVVALAAAACSKPDVPPPPPPVASTATPAIGAAGGKACPATGLWAPCSLIYHLERAGLAPKVDSTGTRADSVLSIKPIIVKIGQSALLELYVYPDSAARVADGAKLDRTAYVNATRQQTMNRERTLIESANVIGLLTSLNAHQRERVSDALTAGPPQPSKP